MVFYFPLILRRLSGVEVPILLYLLDWRYRIEHRKPRNAALANAAEVGQISTMLNPFSATQP